MFEWLWNEPKKESPRWARTLWPYLVLALYDTRSFIKILRGTRFFWHYSWEDGASANFERWVRSGKPPSGISNEGTN
jgi:hypothetical protein